MKEPKTIEGEWRILGDRRRAYLGSLNYDPEAGLELVVKAAHNRGDAGVLHTLAHIHSRVPKSIRGFDRNRRAITLFGCVAVGSNHSAGFESHTIYSKVAILGGHFRSWQEVTCSGLDVHYSLLDNWLLRPVVDCEQLFVEKSTFHPLRHPDIVVPIKDGVSLTITHRTSLDPSPQEFRISQQHFVRFSFVQPVSLRDAWTRYISPFCILLTILTKIKAFIDSITFESMAGQNAGHSQMEFLAVNRGVGKSDRKTISPHMLVPYEEVAAQLPQLITAWFTYYRKMEAIISLYFTAVWSDGIPSTTQFLLLAQALEAYHNRSQQFTSSIQSTPDFRRRLAAILDGMACQAERSWVKEKLQHANQKNLAQRLNDLILRNKTEVARFICDPVDFANKIRHTRNYYTHFDEDLKRRGKVAEDKDLVMISIWMSAILLISFFRDLGLSQAAIDRVVCRAQSVGLITLDT